MTKRRWLPRKLSAYFGDRLRRPRARERQEERELRAERWQEQQARAEWETFLKGDTRTVSREEIRRIVLESLADDAERHPQRLGDVGELLAGIDELLEGVEATPDDGVATQDAERTRPQILQRLLQAAVEARGPRVPLPRFEIWDTFSAAMVEDFDTLALALAWIRGQIAREEVGGEDPASGVMQWWALIEVHEQSWGTLADGKALLALARELS